MSDHVGRLLAVHRRLERDLTQLTAHSPAAPLLSAMEGTPVALSVRYGAGSASVSESMATCAAAMTWIRACLNPPGWGCWCPRRRQGLLRRRTGEKLHTEYCEASGALWGAVGPALRAAEACDLDAYRAAEGPMLAAVARYKAAHT